MYKYRLKRWGLDNKNNRGNELRAVVRKYIQRARQGKDTACRVRGKAIHYQEIVRYFRRKGMSIEDVIDPQRTSPTPETVTCYTPIPSPLTSPQDFRVPELLFTKTCDFATSSLDNKQSVREEPPCVDFEILSYRCYKVYKDFERGAYEEAKSELIRNINTIRGSLFDNGFICYHSLLNNLARQHKGSDIDALLRVIADFGQSFSSPLHPLCEIARCLLQLDNSRVEEACIRCLRILADQAEVTYGALHPRAIYARLNPHLITEESLRSLLHECHIRLGSYSPWSLAVHMELARYLYNNHYYRLAQEEIDCILQKAHSDQFAPDSDPLVPSRHELISIGLLLLARCQRQLGELDFAIVLLRQVIELSVEQGEHHGAWTREMLGHLCEWLSEDGREEEAAEVDEWSALTYRAAIEE